MGKPHGPTSHKPITKTLENPLLGPHIPPKWVRSVISALPGCYLFNQCVKDQTWAKYDQGFLKTWSRANKNPIILGENMHENLRSLGFFMDEN